MGMGLCWITLGLSHIHFVKLKFTGVLLCVIKTRCLNEQESFLSPNTKQFLHLIENEKQK